MWIFRNAQYLEKFPLAVAAMYRVSVGSHYIEKLYYIEKCIASLYHIEKLCFQS